MRVIGIIVVFLCVLCGGEHAKADGEVDCTKIPDVTDDGWREFVSSVPFEVGVFPLFAQNPTSICYFADVKTYLHGVGDDARWVQHTFSKKDNALLFTMWGRGALMSSAHACKALKVGEMWFMAGHDSHIKIESEFVVQDLRVVLGVAFSLFSDAEESNLVAKGFLEGPRCRWLQPKRRRFWRTKNPSQLASCSSK